MSNVVEFLIRARDMATPVLSGLRSQVADLNKDLEKGFMQGLGAGIAFKGIDLAIDKVNALRTALWDAAKQQTQTIATSSDVATNLAVPIGDARKTVEGIQATLAKTAAELPGTTNDYNQAFLAIGGTLAGMFQGDVEGFKAASEEMTKRVGILGSIRGVSGGESGMAMNRLLSGTMGFGEARQLDLFQKNPQLQKLLEAESKQRGLDISRIQKWSLQDRYQVISKALTLAAPDSLINEFKGTTESIIQSWQTNLFDPMVGIFGVSRRIASEGNRTALDALANLLTQIDILTKAMGGMGVDPMKELIRFFDWLALGAAQLAGMRQRGEEFLNFERWYGWMMSIRDGLPDAINAGLAGLKRFLDTVNWEEVGKYFFLSVQGALTLLAKLVASINWGDVVNIFVSLISGAIRAFTGYVTEGFRQLFDTLINGIKSWFDIIKNAVSDPVGTVKSFLGGGTTAPTDNGSGSVFDSTGYGLTGLPALPDPAKAGASFSFNPQVTVTGTIGDDANSIADKVGGMFDQKYQEYMQQFVF